MSTNGFTPGPWEVAPHSSVVFAVNEVEHDEDGSRVAIAQCGSEIKPSAGLKYGSERDANARLIAASPEMFEALQLIMRDLPTRRDWLDPVVEEMAREALKKATEAK